MVKNHKKGNKLEPFNFSDVHNLKDTDTQLTAATKKTQSVESDDVCNEPGNQRDFEVKHSVLSTLCKEGKNS